MFVSPPLIDEAAASSASRRWRRATRRRGARASRRSHASSVAASTIRHDRLRPDDPRDARDARAGHGPVRPQQPARAITSCGCSPSFGDAIASDQDKLIREVIDRVYGVDFYAGDEDNGEMGAWFVLAALGLFSVSPASAGLS